MKRQWSYPVRPPGTIACDSSVSKPLRNEWRKKRDAWEKVNADPNLWTRELRALTELCRHRDRAFYEDTLEVWEYLGDYTPTFCDMQTWGPV